MERGGVFHLKWMLIAIKPVNCGYGHEKKNIKEYTKKGLEINA